MTTTITITVTMIRRNLELISLEYTYVWINESLLQSSADELSKGMIHPVGLALVLRVGQLVY